MINLKGLFGQKLIVKRQKLSYVAALDELCQVEDHLDSLRHIAIAQRQLQVFDQVVLLTLADLHPDADETRVEQVRWRGIVRDE